VAYFSQLRVDLRFLQKKQIPLNQVVEPLSIAILGRDEFLIGISDRDF